ncbi:HU family DNA-binding protein [Salipiger sp. PrR003]|uniref:HU family DNA-binding protein n=1 Tax=Salipiger sp. PrR003 TaxID=2706776 RepID=UPI0013D8E31D|nr:HU family DNA-binding protein [Salipiger sp. PrR003]NDV50416.1 HU family DNA-binding protein [Salipiger sp. PrR003]
MTTKPMTKAELVAAVAEEAGAEKKTTAAILDALTAVVTKEVTAGGAVTLPGLGKVSTRDRAAREVRNPATGEMMQKEADRQVKFTVAKAIKDSVNA